MSSTKAAPISPTYYPYLDNLRVVSFLLLILTHCALIYSRERWNIEAASSSLLAGLLLQVFQEWRLPLLFVVSGLGLHVSLKRGKAKVFLERRIIKLGLPLLLGLFVILPLQNYLVAIWQLGEPSFVNALTPNWVGYLTRRPSGLMDWHHLWVLVDLWVLGIGVFCVKLFWGRLTPQIAFPILSAGVSLVIIALLIAAGQGSRYVFGSLFGHNLAYFLIGLLVGPGNPVWSRVRIYRFEMGIVVTLIVGLKMYLIVGQWVSWLPTVEPGRFAFKVIVDTVFRFTAIMGMVYAFTEWLNKPISVLTKLNTLIMPIYLWHMVVILLLSPLFIDNTELGDLQFVVHTFLSLTLSILLAEALYRLGPISSKLHGILVRP